MLSKKTGLVLTAIFTVSCGSMGEKEPPPEKISYQTESSGCLNDFGENMKKYLDATVDAKEWEDNFDCVGESLRQFKKMARPSDKDGYTRKDIYNLVSRTMLTEIEVPEELINTSFMLKSSIFGGTKKLLTLDELDRIIEFVKVLKEESTMLIPHLKARKKGASIDTMLALSGAFESGATKIGAFLTEGGSTPFKRETALVLVAMLNRIHHLDIDSKLVTYFFDFKPFLVGGDDQQIEPKNWKNLFNLLSLAAGNFLAYYEVKEDSVEVPYLYFEFLDKLIDKAEQLLAKIVENHNGRMTFDLLDSTLDLIPNDLLSLERTVLKDIYRLVARKVLHNTDELGIGQGVLNEAFAIYRKWSHGRIHVYKIFHEYNLDPNRVASEQFVEAALQYRDGLPAAVQPETDRLIDLARTYKPVFLAEGDDMVLSTALLNSLNNMYKFHFYNLIADEIMAVYASARTQEGEPRFVRGDIQNIFDDFGPLTLAMKRVDYNIKSWPRKRFGEADMFTLSGNGDGLVDIHEATYEIAAITSITAQAKRMMTELQDPCKNGDGEDPLGIQWMERQCFYNGVFGDADLFLGYFEDLLEYLRDLPVGHVSRKDDRAELQFHMEKGSRRYGATELPVGNYDATAMAGVIHYMETAFFRFDRDHNQILDTQEVVNAYPVYGRRIAELGELDPDNKKRVRAVFAWLINFGERPGEGIMDKIKYLIWELKGPDRWDIHADHMNIYKIASFFNEPEDPPTSQ